MKSKKIFNYNLFKEGFNQLKVLGIVSFIIYMLEAILILIENSGASGKIVGLFNIHPIIVVTYTVLAPVFTLYLFRFLSSRNSSDYYHSIPHTRTCIYFSYLASIVAWLAIIHFVTSGITIGIHACMSHSFIMNWNQIFPLLIGTFIAALGVTFAITLADCITGTIFTNVVVTGIILFMPRLLTLAIFMNFSILTHDIVPVEYFNRLLTGGDNMITAPIFSVFTSMDFSFTTVNEWIYTGVLAIIYLLAGLYLFNKRNSEAAGNSAPNRTLQLVYRTCVTMIFCIFPISVACSNTEKEIGLLLITLYVTAIVIYFMFELITTRTTRNLLKIIPGLLIIAILNIALIAGIHSISNTELNRVPASKDVKYVTLIPERDSYNDDSYKYTSLIAKDIKIDDNSIISTIITSLKNDINGYKTSDNYFPSSKDQRIFKIHCANGKDYYRTIFVTSKVISDIGSFYAKNDTYSRKLSTLPDYKNVSVTFDEVNFNSSTKERLYNVFKEEYESLSSNDKLKSFNDNGRFIDDMVIKIPVKNNKGIINVTINDNIPKTKKAYLDTVINKNKNFKAIKNTLSDVDTAVLSHNNSIDISFYYNNKSIQLGFWEENSIVQTGSSAPITFTDKTASEILADISETIPDNYDDYKNSEDDKNNMIVKISDDYGTMYCTAPLNDNIKEILDHLN